MALWNEMEAKKGFQYKRTKEPLILIEEEKKDSHAAYESYTNVVKNSINTQCQQTDF